MINTVDLNKILWWFFYSSESSCFAINKCYLINFAVLSLHSYRKFLFKIWFHVIFFAKIYNIPNGSNTTDIWRTKSHLNGVWQNYNVYDLNLRWHTKLIVDVLFLIITNSCYIRFGYSNPVTYILFQMPSGANFVKHTSDNTQNKNLYSTFHVSALIISRANRKFLTSWLWKLCVQLSILPWDKL